MPVTGSFFMLDEHGNWLVPPKGLDDATRALSDAHPAQWQEMVSQSSGRIELDGQCHYYAWYEYPGKSARSVNASGVPAGNVIHSERWLVGEQTTGRSCDWIEETYVTRGLALTLAGALVTLPLLWLWHRSRRRLKASFDQLRVNEAQLRLITGLVGTGVVMVDDLCRVQWVNPEAERLLGWRESELAGKNFHETVHIGPDGRVLHDGDCPTLKTLATGVRYHSDRDQFVVANGDFLDVSVTTTPFGNPDVEGAIITFSDAREQRARENMLHNLATIDALTQVANRRSIIQHLQECIEQQGHTPGVLILDIDHFKLVNDTYGHPAGDQVLYALCRKTETLLGASDHLGRLGGEEFVVVVRDASQPQLMALAERIRTGVESMTVDLGKQGVISIKISLGAAVKKASESSDQLLARADQALYEAKSQGRNRVVYSSI